MKHLKSKEGKVITFIAKIHEKLELEVSPFGISWRFLLRWQVKGCLLFDGRIRQVYQIVYQVEMW
jgi:hypothetical protein